VRRAFTDTGREVPKGFEDRTLGVQDVGVDGKSEPSKA
jgi:hypothetical protein